MNVMAVEDLPTIYHHCYISPLAGYMFWPICGFGLDKPKEERSGAPQGTTRLRGNVNCIDCMRMMGMPPPQLVHFVPYGSYVASCGRIEDNRYPEQWNDERKYVTCAECQAQMTDLGDLPRAIQP